MKPLFEVKKVDANFYEAYLRDFLPDRIVDCHSHVWCQSMLSPDPLALSRTPAWPWRVARDKPLEDLIETYTLLFPGKHVSPWILLLRLPRTARLKDPLNLTQLLEIPLATACAQCLDSSEKESARSYGEFMISKRANGKSQIRSSMQAKSSNPQSRAPLTSRSPFAAGRTHAWIGN